MGVVSDIVASTKDSVTVSDFMPLGVELEQPEVDVINKPRMRIENRRILFMSFTQRYLSHLTDELTRSRLDLLMILT